MCQSSALPPDRCPDSENPQCELCGQSALLPPPLSLRKMDLSENSTVCLTIIQRWGILFNAATEALLGRLEIMRVKRTASTRRHLESICSGIEVVITGLTRNQFVGNYTWVRIPPAAPERTNGLDAVGETPTASTVSGLFTPQFFRSKTIDAHQHLLAT